LTTKLTPRSQPINLLSKDFELQVTAQNVGMGKLEMFNEKAEIEKEKFAGDIYTMTGG